MQWFEMLGIAIAAISAGLAAVSARQSKLATLALLEDVQHNRQSTAFEFVRFFEVEYASQYDDLRGHLGEWQDTTRVDPELRRVVGRLLSTLASIHVARERELIDPSLASYLMDLYVDWLRVRRCRKRGVASSLPPSGSFMAGGICTPDRCASRPKAGSAAAAG